MNELAKTLRELHDHIKNHIITDCFLAYEVVDVVTGLAYRLETSNIELKQPIVDAVRPVRETAKYSLQRLIEDTRNRIQGLITLPADSSPVQITYDTMSRLQTMTTYIAPLGSILASVGEGGWRTSQGGGVSSSGSTIRSFDVGVNGTDLFAHYAADTIESLLSNLESKARTLLKTKSVQGVFIANNVAIVDRMIASSDLQPLISDSANAKLDSWRKKGIAMYLDGWREPSIHLRDVQYTNRGSNPAQRPPSGAQVDSAAFVKTMSNKDKEATRDKFRNFNSSFEDLVARHRTYRMEREVRQSMAREIAAMIEPLYTRFWDRYHELDKKGKYVRYDKAQLNSIVSGLG